MKKIVFIKLGGSLITDKSKPNSVRLDIIQDLSRQIKRIIDENKDIFFIIGNGAGSFGHHLVKKYNLQAGVKSEEQKLGLTEVQNSCATLNRIVVSALIKGGVKAVSINPSSIIVSKDNQPENIYIESILNYFNLGLVPVVYGDMVFDKVIGASIFSTEKQFLVLIKKFKENNLQIEKVIFCSVTNGVLDKTGKTIEMITNDNYLEMKNIFFDDKSIDVTGKMKQKVESCLELAKEGIESYIINGHEIDALLNTLLNKQKNITVIK